MKILYNHLLNILNYKILLLNYLTEHPTIQINFVYYYHLLFRAYIKLPGLMIQYFDV